MPGSRLLARILDVSEKAQLGDVAVAMHDYDSSVRFSYQGERWFHAASTFKAAILFALFKAAESGAVRLDAPLAVRNRFLSVVDQSPYKIGGDRDGDSAVHKHIGRAMPIIDLARAMIVRSSNLATNLLLNFLTLEQIRGALAQAGVFGLEVRRGVEDIVAHQQGINNEATADGLLRLFRLFLNPDALNEEHRKQALDILLAQEFNSMIPARLPKEVKVAHKTGEISTYCHDAGIVFIPDRQPYALAIMTETGPQTQKRAKAVADISHAIHRYVVAAHREEKPHDD